jgi:predicted ATP-grasp superfamily ATP-dependent carboligase
VMCLLGPAKANFPDARGAARLLEIVGKMLPELKLDPEPLYREAEQIEQQMKNSIEGIQQSRPLSDGSSMIYG